MIGEDGRMTDGRGRAFAGLDGRRGARRRGRDAARAGADSRHAAVPAQRAALAPLRRAHRAADLAAVVLRHGRARAAGDRGRARRARALPPRGPGPASTSTGWRTSGRGASRASSGGATSCRSGTAATRPTSARSAPEGEGWERDADVLDTWFRSGAVAVRDARLARRDARAARLLPDRRALHGARHHLPLGRAHGDVRACEFTGERAVPRRLHPLGDPGARRPAHVEVARHGHRPARADRRARRRRHALRPARDELDAGRALQRGQHQGGPRARQQALERLAADPAARRPTSSPTPRAARASRTAGSSRASSALPEGDRARSTAYEFALAANELYDFSGTSCATGTSRSSSRGSTRSDNAAVSATLLYVLDRTLRLLHPVMPHVTEEIWRYLPARARAAGRGRLARARTRAGRGRRGSGRADDRGRHRAAPLPRRRRRDGGRAVSARLEPRLRGGLAARWRGSPASSGPTATATASRPRLCRSPAATSGARQRGDRPRRGARRVEAQREKLRGRSSGPRPSSPTCASSKRAPTAGRRRRAQKLERATSRAGNRLKKLNLAQAEAYLLDLELFGMRFGLDRMHKLMTALGMPQRRFASLHVVGSNGKSSTVRMTRRDPRRARAETGAYLSPHLTSFAERIEVGGGAGAGGRLRGGRRARRARR